MTTPDTQLTRTQRLDSLTFTKKHRKLLAGSGIGWALDAMDVGIMSFVLAALASYWPEHTGQLSYLASIGFVGMAIGASFGGLLADKIGRRQVFAITLLVFGIATGLSALAWSVTVLIVLRFVVGLGLGAELPVASTLMSEFSPPRIRGRVIVILEGFWAIGWLAAALVGYFVIPQSHEGWRWALLIGSVPAIYAAVVRFSLPESVRFLEQKGRIAEAERIVQEFELSAGVIDAVQLPAEQTVTEQQPVVAQPDRTQSWTENFKTLWSKRYRGQTIALWTVWFCINFSYYGAFIWLPTILTGEGYDLTRSFLYTVIITLAQIPGYAASAYLIEKWGRRQTLATFLVGSALSAAGFGFAGSTATILIAGMCLSFFNLGAWGALYAVSPELYPTSIRATGAGWAAGFGRIASIIAPLLVPILTGWSGNLLAFSVLAAFFIIASVAAYFLNEKKGQVLEES